MVPWLTELMTAAGLASNGMWYNIFSEPRNSFTGMQSTPVLGSSVATAIVQGPIGSRRLDYNKKVWVKLGGNPRGYVFMMVWIGKLGNPNL